ncbi:MAG: glycosyltransferase family 39 protein [Mucinivorans sp.]
MKSYIRKLYWLMGLSFLVRLVVGSSVELGNDEVYYRIFALMPDWSYFDHPPLVAWTVWLTTLGSVHASEWMVRLGPIIIGTINTYIIYRMGGGQRRGLIAALLYTGSLYCSVIVGTFIMPDSPLSLFWLMALWLFMEILPRSETALPHYRMLMAGLCVGLAMLSKYTGGYLWAAAGLYILLFNRTWLKGWSLWVAALLSLLLITPVVYWNAANDFISFTYHASGRVVEPYRWLFFGRELLGGIGYNNPINFVVIVTAIVAWARGRKFMQGRQMWLLLIFSLPMVLLFWGVALTRETLPHWSAPAYFALILVGAAYLDSLPKAGLRVAFCSASLALVVLIVGVLQVNYGIIELDKRGTEVQDIGGDDFSLDMYGWHQAGEQFAQIYRADTAAGRMRAGTPLLHYCWDYAAHVDNYVALPMGLKTFTMGRLVSTHYYEWINRRRGGIHPGMDFYLLNSSPYMLNPEELYGARFDSICPPDTLKVYRRGRHVMSHYLYRLKGLKK